MEIEKTDKGLGLIDKALTIVEKYKVTTILKAICVLLMVSATIGFISHPTFIFEKYAEWQSKNHQEQLAERLEKNYKINNIIQKSLYKLDADRIILLELHNGLNGLGGLPFAKATATFEVLNETQPVAGQYQDFNLSLMPFSTYIFEREYWCGDTDDLENIDRGLYYKMKGNGTNHFASAVVQGVDKPLAILIVSFNEVSPKHNCKEVEREIKHISLEIALLLELKNKTK